MMFNRRQKSRISYLTKAQIETAMQCTRSNRAAASYLKCSYNLYKKYALLFTNDKGITLFEAHKNQAGRGLGKVRENKKKFKLDQILMGKHPTYPREKLYKKIVQSSYMSEKCSHCGYHQKRATDLRSPLILHHKNGNRRDHIITNLEILCFNCYFVLVGNISSKDMKYHVKADVDTNTQYTALDVVTSEENDTTDVEDTTQTQQADEQEFGNVLTDEEKMEIIRKIQGI